uniref:MobC family plasmid mobilization relaxosome protein n=1 Tax=Runella zeae TaxID=94255 RepID=UPI0006854AF3
KTCFCISKTPFSLSRNESWQGEGSALLPAPPPVKKEKMARPKKADSETRTVLRLTRYLPREDELLLDRAAKAGMDLSDFTRNMTLYRKFTPRRPLAETEFLLYLRGEVGRIGNNLNQLVQRLNAAKLTPTEQAAESVLQQLAEINAELLRLLRDGHQR